MTDNKSKSIFEKLACSGLEPAKSKLARQLDQIINAEISTGVIRGVGSALNWLRGTLFYIQAINDPAHHGLQQDTKSIEEDLWRKCQETLSRLERIGALEFDDGQRVRPLAASHIMVRNHIHPGKMFHYVCSD